MNYLITPTLAVQLDDYEAQLRARYVTFVPERLRISTLARIREINMVSIELEMPREVMRAFEAKHRGVCVWLELEILT